MNRLSGTAICLASWKAPAPSGDKAKAATRSEQHKAIKLLITFLNTAIRTPEIETELEAFLQAWRPFIDSVGAKPLLQTLNKRSREPGTSGLLVHPYQLVTPLVEIGGQQAMELSTTTEATVPRRQQ